MPGQLYVGNLYTDSELIGSGEIAPNYGKVCSISTVKHDWPCQSYWSQFLPYPTELSEHLQIEPTTTSMSAAQHGKLVYCTYDKPLHGTLAISCR